MDRLYQLLCIPRPSTVRFNDIKSNTFDGFLDKTMAHTDTLAEDTELKDKATQHMKRLLSAKSNSPNNTLKTLGTVFARAQEACHFDRERAMITWLEVCVLQAVSLSHHIDKPEPYTNEKSSSSRKVSPKKKPSYSDDEEEYNRMSLLGDSDDDYIPSDASVVPTKKKPHKKIAEAVPAPKKESDQSVPKTRPKKKKESDQVVPDASLPVIAEGAGPKAVLKYFESIHSATPSVLPKGCFANSFFFPSKHSFNTFLSVIQSAQKTIDICVFAFTDDDVADALIAAKKRKVTIKIITDNQQAAGKGADAKRLQESHGIPFKTDNTTGYMHNKFAIIDSAILINGSFNWSKGARFKNRENVLITNIPQCIQEFQAQFDALWEEF